MAAVIVAVRVPTSTLTVPDGTWAGVRSRTSDSGASNESDSSGLVFEAALREEDLVARFELPVACCALRLRGREALGGIVLA